MSSSVPVCIICLLVIAFCAKAAPTACRPKETAEDMAAGSDLTGMVAIVTGGDSGLGYAAATALARQRASVVLAARNEKKVEEAARNISAMTGANVRGMPLDLSSLASVRNFSNIFLAEYKNQLNFLLNNAGIHAHAGHDSLTKDGFEINFQINYLGHFLLTELMLPALRKSTPARVVNTASTAHNSACEDAGWPHNCFQDFSYLPPAPVVKGDLYGVSKMLMIEHAAELAKREVLNGIGAFSIGPGFTETAMTHGFDWACMLYELPGPWMHQWPCPYTTGQGAAVIIHAALRATHSGAWYTRYTGCKESRVTMSGFTEKMQPLLYNHSLAWVGLLHKVDGKHRSITI